jgi:KH domain
LVLKVLAHNDYIGRIIGKQGNIINSIKKDTDTTVTVSSINDISMNVERVITVKGELENMVKALEIIHQKIKSAFENDTKTYGPQAIMMTGGMPPMAMPTPAYAPYPPGTRFPGQPNAAPAPYSNYFVSKREHVLLYFFQKLVFL